MSIVSKQEPKLETLTLFQKRPKTAFWERFWGVSIINHLCHYLWKIWLKQIM